MNILKSVYYFLPTTNNNTNAKININNKISKIVSSHFFTVNEIKNINKIRQINDYKTHYYVFNNTQNLQIIQWSDDDDTRRPISRDGNILLQYDAIPIIYLNSYLKALSSSKIYIFQLIEIYRQLLCSIDLLADNKIVHNNIHFESIIISNCDKALLTNFGFSIDISKPELIKQFFIKYQPTYISWPIEFHIVAYLLTNKLDSLSSFNIETIIDEVVDANYILKTFGDTYKTDAYTYFNKYVNRSYEFIITDILQFYKTWDNYALSIMYLRVFIGIYKSIELSNQQISKSNKFIILFMKLLVRNISLHPQKRYSIELTGNAFEDILHSLQPADYKDVIDNLHLLSS